MSRSTAHTARNAQTDSTPQSEGRVVAYSKKFVSLLTEEGSKLRLFEFVVAAVSISAIVVPGLTFPYEQMMLLFLFAYGAIRQGKYELGKYNVLLLINILFLIYLGVVSVISVHSPEAFPWDRRLFRFALQTAIMWFMVTGRLHIRSIVMGYTFGLLINVPLWLAGIAPSHYGEYLTGYLEDKNFSGLVYAVFGVLAFVLVKNKIQAVICLAIGSGLVWWTGSRTSIAAYVTGIIWVLIAPRVKFLWRLVLGLGLYGLINVLTSDYAQSGSFSDRAGTDWFRQRIDDASLLKLENIGIFGKGLGEATIRFPGEEKVWSFHNSYWGAEAEGGLPWLFFMVGMTVFIIINVQSKSLVRTQDMVVIQGTGIALLVCAQRLGEVFFTWPWIICCAYALRVLIITRDIEIGRAPAEDYPLTLDGRVEIGSTPRSVRKAKNANV